MKKNIFVVLIASFTLAICLKGCINNGNNADFGERYDSDNVTLFSPDGTNNMKYQDEYGEIYESFLNSASEAQFVVHQKTALEIALAVIKEAYPNETFQLGGPMNMPRYGPVYYKEGGCWVVVLKNKDYPKDYNPEHLYWIGVYIDVNSGAVRAIIPQSEFTEHGLS